MEPRPPDSSGAAEGAVPASPDKDRERWWNALTAVCDHTTLEVVGALGQADLPYVLLKGLSIATWLYDDPVERMYSDVDLLVHPDRYGEARAILQELGFTSASARATKHDWRHYEEKWKGNSLVEIHWTLDTADAPPLTVWKTLTRETAHILVDGVSVRVLAPPARALHVAVHALQHGPEYDKTMEDLRRAIDRLPTSIWRTAAAQAAVIGATDSLAAGLRLLPEGAALAEQLGLPARPSMRARLYVTTAPTLAHTLAGLVEGSLSGREKLVFVAQKLVPPPRYLRMHHPIARHGLLGLTAGYFVRLGNLAARLPGAVAALLRARRALSRKAD